MKIAYLILAHNHPLHLTRLISALQTEHAYIFLHIDKKSNDMICPPITNTITVLENTVTINWGGFSIVQATLHLLKEATASGDYDYFILLSGVDYPLKSNAAIVRFLQQHDGKEFMNLYKMPEANKPLERIGYFHIETATVCASSPFSKRIINKVVRRINKVLRSPLLKRRYPKRYSHFTLYAGSQWWALSKPCVDYILEFLTRNPEYTKFYKHTRVPDEMFFHTIIGNSLFKKNVVNALIYADWRKGGSHPAVITLQHLPILSQKTLPTANDREITPLFARKFSDSSQDVITEIDTLFRNDNCCYFVDSDQ